MVLCVAGYYKIYIYLQYKQQCKRKYSFKKSSLQFVTKAKKQRLKDKANRKQEEITSEKIENRKQNKVQESENRKTKAMKTKNNVKKAILRSAAVVVSFVLISFTVSAQDFWKRLIENSSFNDIAMAMVETPSETKLITAPTESLEAMYFEIEPEMSLEAWMTDYSKFDVSTFNYTEALDAELNVEEWMLDEDLFQLENAVDASLELEEWMTADKVWNI